MKILALPQNSVMIRVIKSSIERLRTSWDSIDQSWIREENVSCLSFNGICDMWQNSVIHAISAEKAVIAKGMVLYTEESFPQVARAYYDSSD